MVEQAEPQTRGAHHVEPGEGPLGLEQAQQVERRVQDADVPIGGDDEPDRPGEQEREPRGRAHADAPQAGTRGTRASAGSAQRVLGISGAQPGRSGSWSYGYAPSRRKSS